MGGGAKTIIGGLGGRRQAQRGKPGWNYETMAGWNYDKARGGGEGENWGRANQRKTKR